MLLGTLSFFLLISCFIKVFVVTGYGSSQHESSFLLPPVTFPQLLQKSEEGIVCALIKNQDLNAVLEKCAFSLHLKPKYRHMLIGTVDVSNETNSFATSSSGAESLPLLRCFLGPHITSDYNDRLQIPSMEKWLRRLKVKYKHLMEDSVETIKSSLKANEVTIVSLPTASQFQTHSDMLAEVAFRLLDRCNISVITVHPSSKHRRSITGYLQLPNRSSVVAFVKKGSRSALEKRQFKDADITKPKINSFVLSRLLGIKHLTSATFTHEALTVKRTERFRPLVVVFYAWWAHSCENFLSTLWSTIEEFQSISIMVKFAAVDVAKEKSLISRVETRDYRSLPFLILFQKEKGKDTVKQQKLNITHPSVFWLHKELSSAPLDLHDAWGSVWEYKPYQALDPTQYTDLREGPWGTLCTPWSHNDTSTDLPDFLQDLRETATAEPVKVFPYKVVEKQDGISVLTEVLWEDTMDKSSRNLDLFRTQPKIKITLLLLVRDGCGACKLKLPVFKELQQELSRSDSDNVFLVNCTKDVDLCTKLKVQGYPSVMAFRNFGALATPSCALQESEKPYIKRYYHGAISIGELMAWYEHVKRNSVHQLGFSDMNAFHQEDARLIATVIPKKSNYLPLAPRHNRNYFYSPRCFHLVCERLFGLASCYQVYSREIPASEFVPEPHEDETIITQISFERRDNVSMKIMSLGKPIQGLLADETSSTLHLFHKPHKYALQPTQKCEEDHSACSLILESFTRDHLRMPVTYLTSELFHTSNNPVFEDGKPVLIVFCYSDNLTSSSPFMQMLTSVAIKMYQDVVVAAVDVELYPAWAGRFVPKYYYTVYMDATDAGPLHEYPRLCLINWQDHHHSAFYPPLDFILGQQYEEFNISTLKQASFEEGSLSNKNSDDSVWNVEYVVEFVQLYLNLVQFDPTSLVKTEHF